MHEASSSALKYVFSVQPIAPSWPSGPEMASTTLFTAASRPSHCPAPPAPVKRMSLPSSSHSARGVKSHPSNTRCSHSTSSSHPPSPPPVVDSNEVPYFSMHVNVVLGGVVGVVVAELVCVDVGVVTEHVWKPPPTHSSAIALTAATVLSQSLPSKKSPPKAQATVGKSLPGPRNS